MASSKSSPLPCGTPSIMSMRTTSHNSLAAIQCAAVAPTFPDPTTVTFLRINPSLNKLFYCNNLLKTRRQSHETIQMKFAPELTRRVTQQLVPCCESYESQTRWF